MSKASWFSESRFGLFIHWGLYSIPGGVWNGKKIKHEYSEWLQNSELIERNVYASLAEKFNPTAFNAEEWIGYAKQAGMKYFLITSKHHDGFCLWPTKYTAFNVMEATPFKRDIIGELAEACRKNDIKMGLYYSHWQDWDGSGGDITGELLKSPHYRRPTQEEFEHYWQNKSLAQVRELIDAYDPAFFWFDSWGGGDLTLNYMTPKRQDELIELVQKHSSHCLVNSRICFENPPENADFISMMDNVFPEKTMEKPWETSGTLNESWAYHKLDYGWKSTEQLIKNLVQNASYGGNYQLNVGPTANGNFQPAAIKRLKEIGTWMDINGMSIYGTQAGPLTKMPWGTTTCKKLEDDLTQLFIHAWNVVPGTAIHLPGINSRVIDASVLETRQSLKTESGESGVWVHLPEELKNLTLPVLALMLQAD